ncbi:MAG: small subunit ribosomal protein S4e [Halobacteriales archaeon]|jgi:small subunit ribosomal protein S4e
MTRHQKRLSVPDSWPVERKTETFTVKAGAGPHGEAGVPLLILLRDVLGYVDSRKEARYALDQDEILVNGQAISDEQRPIGMFDILAFTEREEYYRVFPDEGGRLALTPIDAEDAESKLGKIVEKSQVRGGKTQLTLHDGQTLLVGDATSYSTKDSIVVSNDDNTIVAHFPYEEGALVTATSGSHAGEVGRLEAIEVTAGSSPNTVTVEQDDGSFETIEEYVVVIDENFVEDEEDHGEAVEETAETEAVGEAEETEAVEGSEDAEEAEDAEAADDEEGGEAE